MAQPVWTLSVDLQAKTATFTSGLADAAKGARGSFNEIKEGAQEMGAETGFSMTEARHSVMLLGEEFGVHLPRALTSFIASLGPIGAAMEAAFPFLAIAVGATLLLEHLVKLKAEGQELTESQVNFGTAVSNVLNALDAKLLEAGIRTDELNNNHLGALHKQLELIDRQSMNELVQAFGVVSKAADATFAQLKTAWYQWGEGSTGAKHALEQFKTDYDSLLAQGKDKEANDLLAGTRQSAERVLQLQKQAKDNQTVTGTHGTHMGDYNKYEEAKIALQKQGIGFTEKEVQAQETLVEALRAQASVEEKVAALKAAQHSNAVQGTQNKIDADGDKAAREQAQNQAKADADAEKLREENYRRAVADLQANEREKIEATNKGSADRLAAIDAAIKEENSKGLQETEFYRSLLKSRVEVTRQMTEQEERLKAEAAKEGANHTAKMAELQLQATKEGNQLLLAQGKMSAQELLTADKDAEEKAYQAQRDALNAELSALNKHDADYQNRVLALNNKLEELQQQHNNRLQQLNDQAAQKQLATLQSWTARTQQDYAQGFSQVIMGKQSFAHMMQQVDSQIAESAVKFALMSLMQLETVQGRKRFGDARTAAADAFASAGNPILGTVEAVAAFGTVMAFEQGGIVPGVGRGDVVPAMLEPGEGVISKRNMERLKDSPDSSGGDVHVHYHHTSHIQAFDSRGVDAVLAQHGDKFTKHAVNTLRKMNR